MQYFMTWELRASLTLQDPIDLSTDERLIRRPAVLGSLGATTKIDQWRIGGDVSYTGSRSDTSATLAAYWLYYATDRLGLQPGTAWCIRRSQLAALSV